MQGGVPKTEQVGTKGERDWTMAEPAGNGHRMEGWPSATRQATGHCTGRDCKGKLRSPNGSFPTALGLTALLPFFRDSKNIHFLKCKKHITSNLIKAHVAQI